MRTLKIGVLVIVLLLLIRTAVSAEETQLVLGASPVVQEKEVVPSYWFPVSLRLLAPDAKPLGFWDTTKGISPLVYQGLGLDIVITPVGFNNLLGVDIGMPGPNSDGTPFNGKPDKLQKALWKPMSLLTNGSFAWHGPIDCPWGSNVVLFRITHKDNKSVVRIIFFKLTFAVKGSLQQAFILNVQMPPEGWRDFTYEESHLYLRGWIPAVATPSDPATAEILRRQRVQQAQKAVLPSSEPISRPTLSGGDGQVTIKFFDRFGRLSGGTMSLRLVYPSGEIKEGWLRISRDGKTVVFGRGRAKLDEPFVVRFDPLPKGTKVYVRPSTSSGWNGPWVVDSAVNIKIAEVK